MLACVLRRSRIDGAKSAAAVIKLLVARLRKAWPDARIIVRGDSGFCRQRLLRWCERQGVFLSNTRRVRILLASHHPLRSVFLGAAQALAP